MLILIGGLTRTLRSNPCTCKAATMLSIWQLFQARSGAVDSTSQNYLVLGLEDSVCNSCFTSSR